MRNPFKISGPIIESKDFIGRREELDIAINRIFNATNLIITGDRGIGKTSLANLVIRDFYKEKGEVALFANYACTKDDTQASIVEGLLVSFEMSIKNMLRQKTKTETTIKTPFPFLEQKIIWDDSKKNINNPKTNFVNFIAEACKELRLSEKHICFFIDEIDMLDDDVDVSSFIKASTEDLQRVGIENTCFLLIGQKGVVNKLKEQHRSFGRYVTSIVLKPMTNEELSAIIENGEKASKVKFDDDVKEDIVTLSKGFPAVTQFLSHYAFDVNRDLVVDYFDFERGLNLAITKLNLEMYVDPIRKIESYYLSKELIDKLCNTDENTLSIDEYYGSPITDKRRRDVDEAVQLLYKQNLIFKYENGTIKLKDRLIAVYYQLTTLQKRPTELVRKLRDIFEKKHSFNVLLIGSKGQRPLNLIIEKKTFPSDIFGLKIRFIVKKEFRYGIICVPDDVKLRDDDIKNYIVNIGDKSVLENAKSSKQQYLDEPTIFSYLGISSIVSDVKFVYRSVLRLRDSLKNIPSKIKKRFGQNTNILLKKEPMAILFKKAESVLEYLRQTNKLDFIYIIGDRDMTTDASSIYCVNNLEKTRYLTIDFIEKISPETQMA